MEGINIVSLNLQGLGSSQKRRDVFHYLREKKYIYFLQDTHSDPKLENDVRSEWGYTCYFASFSFQSRGVAILFNNNFEFNVQKVYKDACGNFMFVSVTTMDKDLLLVNVYGPNRDSPEFYDKMEDYVNGVGLSDIMGGDWNVVLDSSMENCNYKQVNNPLARVEDVILNLDLTDIWRDLNAGDLLGVGQPRYSKAVWIYSHFGIHCFIC